jgi:aspartokinase
MKKEDLLAALLERFERRVNAIKKMREEQRKELQAMVNALRKDYGDELVSLALEDKESPNGKVHEAQPTAARQKKTRRRHKRRKAKPSRMGAPTITSVIAEWVPESVRLLGATGKRFTATQVLENLRKRGLADKRVKQANVSLFLSENAKELGINSEIKKVKHGARHVVTKFFFAKK